MQHLFHLSADTIVHREYPGRATSRIESLEITGGVVGWIYQEKSEQAGIADERASLVRIPGKLPRFPRSRAGLSHHAGGEKRIGYSIKLTLLFNLARFAA